MLLPRKPGRPVTGHTAEAELESRTCAGLVFFPLPPPHPLPASTPHELSAWVQNARGKGTTRSEANVRWETGRLRVTGIKIGCEASHVSNTQVCTSLFILETMLD